MSGDSEPSVLSRRETEMKCSEKNSGGRPQAGGWRLQWVVSVARAGSEYACFLPARVVTCRKAVSRMEGGVTREKMPFLEIQGLKSGWFLNHPERQIHNTNQHIFPAPAKCHLLIQSTNIL
jgi:hypothetical protein